MAEKGKEKAVRRMQRPPAGGCLCPCNDLNKSVQAGGWGVGAGKKRGSGRSLETLTADTALSLDVESPLISNVSRLRSTNSGAFL